MIIVAARVEVGVWSCDRRDPRSRPARIMVGWEWRAGFADLLGNLWGNRPRIWFYLFSATRNQLQPIAWPWLTIVPQKSRYEVTLYVSSDSLHDNVRKRRRKVLLPVDPNDELGGDAKYYTLPIARVTGRGIAIAQWQRFAFDYF